MLMLATALLTALIQDEFQYTEWDAWYAFGQGSSVTFRMKTDQMEMWTTTILEEKTEKKLTLRMKTKVAMPNMDPIETDAGTRSVEKVEVQKTDPEQKCGACGKYWKDHDKPKYTKKEGEIAGKKVQILIMEIKPCTGGATNSMTYSKDVPGWIVEMGKEPNKSTVSAFEAKK